MSDPTPTTTVPEVRRNLLLPQQERWPLDSSKPVIELDRVSVSFGDHHVLRELSIGIVPGLTTFIIGRSGSGKSVLLKVMMGLRKPDHGSVTLFGRDLSTVSKLEVLEIRKRMGMMFQNYALFDALSVDDNVGFSLAINSDMPRPEISKLSHGLIDLLGLHGSELLLPESLSGGMQKRVGLGRALIANPEVVLFDEPTTGLDPIMVEKVDSMIALARDQYQITSVIISHDMASTKRLADRIAFLHDGAIIFHGTPDELAQSTLPPIVEFVAAAQTSRLTYGGPAQTAQAEVAAITDEPSVELVNVYKDFGTKHVLRGVNLKIYPKRTTVLIGASGSGKSVITKHILGLHKPTSGEVRVFGKDIVPMQDRELEEVRRHMGLVFQHAALLHWLCVEDNVAFPLQQSNGVSEREVSERVAAVLDRLKISDVARRMPSEITEGQRRRVGLARAIVMKPDIIVYDEPTTGQDPIGTREIDDTIEQTQKELGITTIVVSHDMASTFRIADMVAMLYQGEIAAYGTPAEVRASSDPRVQQFIHAGTVDTGASRH
ncbi:hypothetical protein BH11MYX2_BH11MYX2_10240 [soil metagenome]